MCHSLMCEYMTPALLGFGIRDLLHFPMVPGTLNAFRHVARNDLAINEHIRFSTRHLTFKMSLTVHLSLRAMIKPFGRTASPILTCFISMTR